MRLRSLMITKTVSELAELCGATLEGDGARTVVGPATLEEARPDQVSFLGNPRYVDELGLTRAGAVLVPPGVASPRADLALLRCENPNRAFSRVVELFRPADRGQEPGVHPSAVVAPDAVLGEGVSVGAHCVVGPGVTLGDGVVLHPGVVLQREVAVGAESVLHPCAVVYARVRIGARCLIHAGVVLGGDGFGFEPTAAGWEKIPQCGTVVVEDEVEIGANSAVDRGRFGATRIGKGAKLDNLVHVAHNVQIGEGALLVAQVGVAGSARVGRRAVLAGQAGVNGHVTVGDGARVAGRGGVVRDLEGGRDYYGHPARPRVEGMRIVAASGRLPDALQKLRELERRLARLEGGAGGESR